MLLGARWTDRKGIVLAPCAPASPRPLLLFGHLGNVRSTLATPESFRAAIRLGPVGRSNTSTVDPSLLSHAFPVLISRLCFWHKSLLGWNLATMDFRFGTGIGFSLELRFGRFVDTRLPILSTFEGLRSTRPVRLPFNGCRTGFSCAHGYLLRKPSNMRANPEKLDKSKK